MNFKRLTFALIILAISQVLSSCAPVSTQGQSTMDQTSYLVQQDTSIGQTFTSRHNGLEGINIYLAPSMIGKGTIQLNLYSSIEKSQTLAMASLPVSSIDHSGKYLFKFSSPLSSYLKDYYLEIKVVGEGVISVGTGDYSSYDEGSLYQNSNPVVAQLTYQPIYDLWMLILGLLGQVKQWLLWLLAAFYLFLLPGYALLTIMWPSANTISLTGRFAISVAASIAVYPLLLLFTNLVTIRLGSWYAVLPGAFALIYFCVRWFRSGKPRPLTGVFFPINWGLATPKIALLLVSVLIVFTRFWAIRAISIPMWGDAVHHTLITQLILDHNGLFQSWEPYANLFSLTYHFGFHTTAAVFSWLTGISTLQSVLIVGQLMNILAVLGIAPLAQKIANGNLWASVGAITIAGLVLPMPMTYVDWSRYTQLTGQVILVGLALFTWELLEKDEFNWKGATLAGIVTAGLALTHYRVLIFFLPILPVLLVALAPKRHLFKMLTTIIVIGAVGGLLFSPWFIHLYGGKLFTSLTSMVSTPATALGDFDNEYNQIGPLTQFQSTFMWFLLALCTAWGLWRKQIGLLVIASWWLLILLAGNPAWIGLPGTDVLTNFAIFIAIYIPSGIILGAGIGWATEKAWQLKPLLVGIPLILIFIISGLFFSKDRLQDVAPSSFALATQPDLRAAQWIKENTSINDKFLVNSFFAYGGSTIVGSDGGWWLSFLTSRQTSLPPMIYTSEVGPTSDYRLYINDLWTLIENEGFTNTNVIAELRTRGIDYAYIGQKDGSVNYSGKVKMNPQELIASGHYKVVYHQDGVWIFEIE